MGIFNPWYIFIKYIIFWLIHKTHITLLYFYFSVLHYKPWHVVLVGRNVTSDRSRSLAGSGSWCDLNILATISQLSSLYKSHTRGFHGTDQRIWVKTFPPGCRQLFIRFNTCFLHTYKK